jgi:urease accessory protein UreH
MPQETILFDGARLARRMRLELSPHAQLLAAGMLVLGRAAWRSRITSGSSARMELAAKRANQSWVRMGAASAV